MQHIPYGCEKNLVIIKKDRMKVVLINKIIKTRNSKYF